MSIEKISTIWPEWEVEKQLGRGSFGAVYKAVRRDNNVESFSAIKVISIPTDDSEISSLRAEGLDDEGTKTYFRGIVDDFVQEIQLMESLKGTQNIVSVEDYRVVPKETGIGCDIFIRMELLTPFNNVICDKKLTEDAVIKLGLDMCEALEICSQRNIIHRDIKPENIFVNDFGHYKLGDFGIARKLENSSGGLSQKGTLNYMAPEVSRGENYDARVDIYSLGIVLYRLLNGNRIPFLTPENQLDPNARKSAVERRMQGEFLPAPSDASPEMAEFILRACAFNPNERFSNIQEMKAALSAVRDGNASVVAPSTDYDRTTFVRRAQPAAAPVLSTPEINTFGKKKSKTPLIIFIVILLLLAVVGTIFAYPYIEKLFEETSTSVSDVVSASSLETVSAQTPVNSTASVVSNNSTVSTITPEEQIQSVLAEAQKFADNNEYTRAIEKIDAGLVVYPESSLLKDKRAEYASTLAMQNKQKTLDEAASKALSEDYLGAMNTVKPAYDDLPDDTDLSTAYNNYRTAYEDSVVKKADAMTTEISVDSAIDFVKEAQANLPDSQKFSDALTRYYAMQPAANYLHKLQYTKYDNKEKKDNSVVILKGEMTNYMDETFTEGLLFQRHYKTSSVISYNLDGEYSKLTGRISLIKKFSAVGMSRWGATGNYFSWYVEFIGDGKSLYKSPMTNVTLDLMFDVNVSGVKDLELHIIPQEENGKGIPGDYYDYDGSNEYIGLSGLELYK